MIHRALLALASIACAPVFALSPCAPSPVNVTIDATEPTYDRSMGAAALTQLSPSGRSPLPGVLGITTGLYVPQTRLSLSSLRRPRTLEHGVASVCFEQFNLLLTLRSVIHVASEISPGSCADQAVLAHEYSHHRIQITLQKQAVDAFLAQNPMPTIPFSDRNPQTADAYALAYGDAYVKTFLESLSNFIDPAQARLDSPYEYQRVTASCPADFTTFRGRVFSSSARRTSASTIRDPSRAIP